MKRALRVSRLPRRQAVSGAGRHRHRRDRSALRHAGHAHAARRRAPRFTSPARSRWGPARCTAAGQPGVTNVAGWDTLRARWKPRRPLAPRITQRRAVAGIRAAPSAAAAPTARRPGSTSSRSQTKDEKKGFFRRLLGVFK